MDVDDLTIEKRVPPAVIAELWTMNVRTVHRWIKDGLPAVNVGSSARPDWRLKSSDVEAWLKDRDEDR